MSAGTSRDRHAAALPSAAAAAFFLALAVGWTRPAAAQSNVVGEWGPLMSWPVVAVHMHLLPTGKALFYPYSDAPHLYDPATNSVTLAANSGHNIFCSGHSFLADGRLLVTGGHIENGWGLPNAAIYDPFADSWTQLPNMNDGRWYPTNTTLANGELLVISGSLDVNFTNNTLPQVWTGSSWRNLNGAAGGLPLYPNMHLAPNGRVFLAGPGQLTRYLDTSGAGSWTNVADRQFPNRDYGSSVLYDDGKVFFAGGGDPPTETAEVIDLNAPSPSWRFVDSMPEPRRQINATLLADGTVLVTGGVSGPGFNNTATPVFSAELWDPVTEQFTTMASMSSAKWYHSSAVLLPDGRLLYAGGDDNSNAQIFSPPYLFQGARPVISSAPSTLGYGQVFFVSTPDATSIASVHLIRNSAVTHARNMDQRINRLSFTQAGGGLDVTAPSSSALAPPGPYMLFILNGNGVPSVASLLRISSGGGSPPAAPTSLAASALSGTQVRLTWTDNSGNEDGFKIERATGGGSFAEIDTTGIDATSYIDSGLSVSTSYQYRVRAFNGSGDSAYSNTASVTTLSNGGTGTGLQGDYYDNIDFTAPALTRTDATVDFDWGSGSPDPSMAADTFSVRWTGQIEPLFSETYTFYTVTDDGVRLWVNGQLVIDQWIDQAPTEWSGTITLSGLQRYDIQVDYYENGGGAVARLLWSSASQPKEVVPQSALYPPSTGGTGTGLQGEYYDNIDFTAPALTRTDATIDFDWGTGSPDPSMGADTFSVRWTGEIEPVFSETYTFYTVTDDGVRLWVNGQLVIDQWIDQAPTEWSGTIALSAFQRYDIRMDYYENGGGAVARLLWSSASQPKGVVPQSALHPPSGGGCTPAATHISSIVPGTAGAGKGQKRGQADVTVTDDCGAPVAGANVTGTFSGDFNETVSATTGSDGVATLQTSGTKKGNVSFTLCVDNVTHATLTYDPGANVETCDGQ